MNHVRALVLLVASASTGWAGEPLPVADAGPEAPLLPPPRLRACCVLGHDLRTEIGGGGTPLRLDNTVAAYQLGHHGYLPPSPDQERNGLVYTCAGGVADVSHLRDYADWTRFLLDRVERSLGSAASIPLPEEGASRAVLLRAFPAPADPEARRALALALAQRIAFDLSIWHEIVTWYDFRSVPTFSERVSAFSPEDVYSNALGILAAGRALRSDQPYDQALDAELAATLSALEPLPPRGTRDALDAVDGLWWDHRYPVPEMRLVPRRHVTLDPLVRPWVIPAERVPGCRYRRVEPRPAAIPTTTPAGEPLDGLYELRFTVDVASMPRFHQPDVATPWITQREFPFLVERIREEIRETFGPLGDVEWASVDEAVAARAPAPDQGCGPTDPDCALTRRQQASGVRLLQLELSTNSFLNLGGGLTLANIATFGGSLQVLPMRVAGDFRTGQVLLKVEAVSTPDLLSLCTKYRDDGSMRTQVPVPFVNPFDASCLPGAVFGLRLDLLELILDGRRSALGVRPAELGAVWNLLGNGFTADFLRTRLLLSLGVAPELLIVPGRATDTDLVLNARLRYRQQLWDSRFLVGTQAQFSVGVVRASTVLEWGAEVAYNLLLSFGEGRDRTHQLVTFGFEGGIDWWPTANQALPPLNGRVLLLPDRSFPQDFWGFGLFYIETSVATLGF